ncbi:MAG: tetratricopeptide repeat protein [Chloroflexi bacterium]|nr:tetratricopeptide repeat protein [Chloroflexota bacterium]
MIELLLVGDRLLEAGDLDHAERIYRQVAEADPRNAIAVVGLARVAAARGDAAEAAHLAARALAIDPDDVAARRLAALAVEPVPASAPTVVAGPATEPAAVPRPSLLARFRAFLGLGG